MSCPSHPIIVVTGANAGVGFAICQRLIEQLCHEEPQDALPQAFCSNDSALEHSTPATGLTLILGCRSLKKAQAAKERLLLALSQQVQKLDTEHARKFAAHVVIDYYQLDFVSLDYCRRFARDVLEKYPYVSHFIANAGGASYIRIDWFHLITQFLTGPVEAVTTPRYGIQEVGERSLDGFGYVWQSNVFSHYVLYRLLDKSFKASPTAARMIWTSSLDAHPRHLDLDDFQLLKNPDSYSSSKYEIDLIAVELERRASLMPNGSSPVKHLISHPGVFISNIAFQLTGVILTYFQYLAFLFARWCGSPNHPISAPKAAIAAVHLCLAPLLYITPYERMPKGNTAKPSHSTPVRFGSASNILGHPYVRLSPVVDWQNHSTDGAKLVDKFDEVYEKLESDWKAADIGKVFGARVERFDPELLARDSC